MSRAVVLCSCLLAVGLAALLTRSSPSRPDHRDPSAADPNRRGGPDAAGRARSTELPQLATSYATGWSTPQRAELVPFSEWADRYLRSDALERAALEAEGVAVGRERRRVMRELIASDPRGALAASVPIAVRQLLPTLVQAELETRISGRGDYLVVARTPAEGNPPAPVERMIVLGGTRYVAHVYGRRLHQLSKRGALLHGIALDGHMAVHESPFRDLEPGEPVAAPDVLSRWFDAETAAASAPSRTLGPQRVLVVRVDFSDLPGASVSAADAQTTMDTIVRPFFETASYGLCTLETTVSSKVYRLPRTAASYGGEFQEWSLHTDARAAAAADFAVSTFDRVIVTFPYIGSSRIPGSHFNDVGRAIVGAEEIWINGTFAFHPVAHELGHTFGLVHSNLWQVSDGNPISPTGRSLEYGDPFDIMGTATEPSGDFNLPEKHRLRWLPDTAIRSISTSGTYRVYRFDHPDALALGQPLALRVPRDGQRSYWIGLRQKVPSTIAGADGAYIVWAYDAGSTDLLDLVTPGRDSRDAVLPVGGVLDDPIFGIRIKPVARGGTGSAQFLDLEITVSATPPNGVWAWGSINGVRGIPPGLSDLRAIDANDSVVVAARANGSLVSWWAYGGGFASVPAGITNAATVAANGGVLKIDGTVEFWGPGWPGATPPPPGLSGVRQLAMGYAHTLALKFDGTLVSWGLNEWGERSIPPDLKDVVSIAAGKRFSVAVRSDGTVVRWGRIQPVDVPPPADLRNARAVVANHASDHFIVLRADGTVLTAGGDDLRQTRTPAGLNNVVAVAAGSHHSLALRADGSVVGWGSSGTDAASIPPNLPRAYALSANSQVSYALTGSGAFVTAQPRSETVAAGSSTRLSVTVSSLTPPSYQWRRNGIPITGATTATLSIAQAVADDAGFYDVVVSTANNRITSLPARVAVVPPLVIASQPQPQTVLEGGAVTFSVQASGGGPIQYQWRRNGVPIPGATGSTWSISRVAASDSGSYDVTIADGVSAVTSTAARLAAAPSVRIANLSIRSPVGSGAGTLIVGFVIGGRETEGTKPLLLRAVGPGLLAFGIEDALRDPKLELYDGNGKVDQNDDWAGNPQLAGVAARVGAFALEAGSRDAALFPAAMAVGSYTAQVTGAGEPAGVAVAEIYDAENAATIGPSSRRLVNVSARTDIGAGAEVLIAGFNLSGSGRKTVLIRGIGPTLATLGVSGALVDPRLDLFDGRSVKLQENDDWGGNAALTGAFASAGAFPLAAGSKDAALLVTLDPGTYSVQVSGVGGTAGAALVEIYEVPASVP